MATDFPTKDDDKKVSLRNSNYAQFDYDFIAGVKENDNDIEMAVLEVFDTARKFEGFILKLIDMSIQDTNTNTTQSYDNPKLAKETLEELANNNIDICNRSLEYIKNNNRRR